MERDVLATHIGVDRGCYRPPPPPDRSLMGIVSRGVPLGSGPCGVCGKKTVDQGRRTIGGTGKLQWSFTAPALPIGSEAKVTYVQLVTWERAPG